MNFSEIEGHDRTVGILKRALANDTLAHAYLFSGPDGVGKKLTALTLAAAVNCPDRNDAGGCGVCPSCIKSASGNHPDVHLLAPDGDEIKIDQVRQAQADFSLKAFEGRIKTLVVERAESMNPAAANAFLKMLEEPPGDALIVLITQTPFGLLPTIRSRCQEIRFMPLPRTALAKLLRERRGLSETDAWFLAALSQGSLGRGLEMDVQQEQNDRGEFLAFLPSLAGMSAADVMGEAERLAKDRERFDRVIELGAEFLRDALVWRETNDKDLLVHPGNEERCREWGNAASSARLLADRELFESSRTLLEQRVGAQLVAEHLLLGLARRQA
jgi:DNA polymerase-3 subunit delta'